MVSLDNRINSFSRLGNILAQLMNDSSDRDELADLFQEEFDQLLSDSVHYNGWFTKEMVLSALRGIVTMLDKDQLLDWVAPYVSSFDKEKRVGVILAGNIPAVGFHDFLAIVISGNICCGKLSSKDKWLLPFIGKVLIAIDKELELSFQFTTERLPKIDAIIATGSDNSAKYFEHYFGKYPNIIRRNRSSLAILKGNESDAQLKELGKDLFLYYGLGCRNVSKLFVPKGYDFKNFFEGIVDHGSVAENNKYFNNYEYNKTIYLLNSEELLDNNFVVLREDEGLSSPIGVIYYSYYSSIKEVELFVEHYQDQLQCIIGEGYIPFGQSQSPGLNDYADNIDSLSFLTSIS